MYYPAKEPATDCNDCWAAWFVSKGDKDDIIHFYYQVLQLLQYNLQEEKKPKAIMVILDRVYRAGQHDGAQNPYC
jgi:hypothetical protein